MQAKDRQVIVRNSMGAPRIIRAISFYDIISGSLEGGALGTEQRASWFNARLRRQVKNLSRWFATRTNSLGY
jgi:hypothetical protein